MQIKNISQLPETVQKDIPDFVHSGKEFYLVTNKEQVGVMDAGGGKELFGEDDWELILNGWHDSAIAIQLEITLN